MIQELGKEELQSKLKDGTITAIDVRTAAEIAEGVIEGALTGFDWNSGEFYDHVDSLDPTKEYALICRSGARSMQAAMALESMGFSNVYNFKGGMMAWNS
jgi:rhodanese-related sulfurtransferase